MACIADSESGYLRYCPKLALINLREIAKEVSHFTIQPKCKALLGSLFTASMPLPETIFSLRISSSEILVSASPLQKHFCLIFAI
jgi:hypothetical protein